MQWKPERILSVFDQCCSHFTFPMLDNGYVYLAATRLSLYRTEFDWGMVIEVFGFSPRSGLPDTGIYTFASTIHNRHSPENYKDRSAHDRYLENNPHNEFRSAFPLDGDGWIDVERDEVVAEDARELVVRGRAVRLPSLEEYGRRGIHLQQPPRVRVFELCRFLAEDEREQVLATPAEKRISLPPELDQILQLEAWNHPDLANDHLPSQSETFQQLAQVLATGDVGLYRPSHPPNMHWRNWPDGGSL
ncbi:MAG: hypothetical protein WBE13_02190 [Candidatus Acidiferrum sp.]